ncbi:MAG: aminoacyl-tRNA hydrolase [Clostridia bacterium]
MLIIVGLGNPTEEYANTFHNMGYMAVERLAESLGKKIKKAECSSLTSTFSRGGEKIVLAKPLTYMNLSGRAVKSLLQKHKATPSELIVLFDDFDIDRFTVRVRAEGGAGTHNGMKSIIEELQTNNFKRIRIGIGSGEYDKKEYVLSSIKKEDKERFQEVFDALAKSIGAYIKDRDFDKLMREVNSR